MHICSPSSASGTGWWQFEHLTVGRSWDMRPGGFAGVGVSSEAIMAGWSAGQEGRYYKYGQRYGGGGSGKEWLSAKNRIAASPRIS